MSARHTLPFVCFACRKSFKISIDEQDDRDLVLVRFTLPCPQCASAMPFAGRYFKAPSQSDEKGWAKVHLLWKHDWFVEERRGSPKSLCDAQTALLFVERQRHIEESRQRRRESETKWRRASRRRRDF